MTCINCDQWPAPEEVAGCCTPPEGFDPVLGAVLWEAAARLIHRLTGGCWQVCHHTIDLCRPCRCPDSCNLCGCCRTRVQVPWTCATIETISSNGIALDPADWNLVDGWLWPTSCSWPCQITVEVAVGDEPPAALLTAAKTIWCRLIEVCNPATCDLPEGTISVTSPDGVTVRIRTLDEWLAKDMVGLVLVDMIVAGYGCPQPEVRMIDPVEWQTVTFQ